MTLKNYLLETRPQFLILSLVLAILGLIFVYQNAGVAVGSVTVASVIMILEVFVAFLQAYIFALLSAVYLNLAVEAEH